MEIKNFEDFNLPFSNEDIENIFLEFEDEDFDVDIKIGKRVTNPKFSGKEMKFDFNKVIEVTLSSYDTNRLNLKDDMNKLLIKHKPKFKNIIRIFESRGCKVEFEVKINKFKFYIYK